MYSFKALVKDIADWGRAIYLVLVAMPLGRYREPEPRRIVVDFRDRRWSRYQASRINEFGRYRRYQQHRGTGYRGRSASHFRLN